MSSPEPARVAIPVGHAASVLDAAQDPAVVVRLANEELTIIGCNDAFADLVGQPMGSLMRRTVNHVFGEPLVDTVIELLASGADSRPVVVAENATVNGLSC